MPLPIRPIAVKFAVAVFFVVGIIGMVNGLSPETCSLRAGLGALAAYVAAALAVRAINAILTYAMITGWMEKRSEEIVRDDA